MKAIAVIGMNYGDEGKGHITNYFSDSKTLNIRFNGGAQAAHAVFLSDGRNHIFHHFGSGSLRGARTLLASKFIVNPILFSQELAELSKKVNMREVFIDPRCGVSTHYDMLINSFTSVYRGANNTCGVGINETIERSKFRQLRIGMVDLVEKTETQLRKILEKIENEYVPFRLQELNLPSVEYHKYCKKRIQNPYKTISSYIETVKLMLKYSVIWPDDNLIERFLDKEKGRKIIFEGAQGLLLDQRRKEYMPFLTRSNTGLKNIFYILKTIRRKINLDVYLVSRTYLTRHGEGPLFNEIKLPYKNIQELTNPENPYQGKMRYGLINEDWYDTAIKETLEFNKSFKYNLNVGVALTCTDHVKNKNLNYVRLISNGPTEKHIKEA